MSEREIYIAAKEKPTPAARAAFLDKVCGQDRALREHVESLLREDEGLGSFLEKPAEGLGATGAFRPAPDDAPPIEAHELPGTVIGSYKLLQKIGEGGMGVVFMAEQTHPVQRKVALKIIKPGMDSRQVIARFEAERQALAMMDHVNIARVFDGGTTGESSGSRQTSGPAGTLASSATGRPYFVMELVHGVPITKYCDDNHLTPRERLELFVPVCQAIQHAHQKGIIHRDIKPSNVMVTLYDGKPVPKVIDFGVAKATEQKLTERTLFTQFGTMVGTLEYMSPEQAEMSALGVDTRSDIYSLGVLLYELLTGSTPLTNKRMKEAAYAEILRMIKEVEPQKPSTRLSDSGEALASISANRHMEPAKLTKLVRGELDWIVMKTLEKDRNRRYETPKDFAADVQRYLDDEPVLACPPSRRYRLRKFVRRNKGLVLAASLVFLALVVGVVGTTLGLFRAEQERQIAQDNEQRAVAAAEAEKKAKESAQAREAETKALLEFIVNKVIAAARPKGQAGGLGHDVTLRRALEAALPFVDKTFPEQPLIEARLRMSLAVSFGNLGEAKIAADQAERARAIYSKHLGPDHPDTLASMHAVAMTYAALGRHAEALKLGQETLALMKAKLGPNDPKTLAAMNNLALSYATIGQHGEALKLAEETLALRKVNLGPDHPTTLGSMNNLALAYSGLGRYPEALKLAQETVARTKTSLGLQHRTTIISMESLAYIYGACGQHPESVRLYEETVPLMKEILGPNQPPTMAGMHDLAGGYAALGRHGEAVKLYDETLERRKANLGLDHSDTLASMNQLARLLATSSDPRVRNASRAVELAKAVIELSSTSGHFWNTLGVARYRSGDWKVGITALEKSMELGNGGDSFDWFFLAMSHWQLGEKDKARQWYDRAAQWMEKNQPTNEELRRFRAEAAELLGIEKKKD